MSTAYSKIDIISLFFFFCKGGLSCKRPQEPLDGIALVLGVQTLLRQFHPEVGKQFLLYISQYIKSHIDSVNL